MEDIDDYYGKKGGCDIKAVVIIAALTAILSLILSILD
jgi:hypothetical protein